MLNWIPCQAQKNREDTVHEIELTKAKALKTVYN